MSDGDERLDALLSQGRLSGPERERILKAVLDHSVVPRAARWSRWSRWLLGGTVALAAATAGVVLVPRLQRDPGGFTARGVATPAAEALQIDLGCVEGTLDRCPSGGTLLFGVRGEGPQPGRAYVGAYARPAGGGEPIWYFSADGESPVVATQGPVRQQLSRGVRLGPEHQPGRYEVVVVLAETPLDKRALLAAPAAGQPPRPGEVARRTFEVTVVAP